ncbi:MAG: tail protein X [Pseudomonadota bacterium]
MTETVTVRQEGLTLDMLLVRRFGLQGQTLIAKTLDLNPGLSAAGTVLPIGREVVLPATPLPEETAAQVTVVDLFS